MLEVMVDKFIFRVEEERFYSHEGVWVAIEGTRARLGLTDFAQQLNGDLAFASVKPVGTRDQSLGRLRRHRDGESDPGALLTGDRPHPGSQPGVGSLSGTYQPRPLRQRMAGRAGTGALGGGEEPLSWMRRVIWNW